MLSFVCTKDCVGLTCGLAKPVAPEAIVSSRGWFWSMIKAA
jgi:hypothetical protein